MTWKRPGWWSRLGHTRGRLIGLAVIAAIPITAMAVTISWQAYQAVSRTAQDRATLLDGQALAGYHAAFSALTGGMRAFLPRISGGRCDPTVADDMGVPTLSFLTLTIDGATVCRIGPEVALPPRPYPWFEQVRGGAPEAITRFGGHGSAAVAIRGLGGDVAVAVLPPAWLDSRALSDRLDAGDAVWLLDEGGAVLASRGAVDDALPVLATVGTLVGAAQTAVQASSAQGLRYAYATTLLPGHWRLITATSAQREHEKALRELATRLAELAALLLAGLAAVVLGADLAFGNPLRRLSMAVRRWQGGAAFEPGDLTGAPDEVLQLARSFHDATGDLRQREVELAQAQERQDLLVLEVHHRVKNNLQVIASLLNLQASRIRVPEARAEFQAARDRVRALATLHRHLYADGELHTINMRSFLAELCGQLFQAMGELEGTRIQMLIDAPELRMSSDQAVPLALIVTEAVTNSVRYAFPGGRSGNISVVLKDHDGELDLMISDDGVGIPAGKAETEAGTRDGIGLQLIRGFSRQLGATLTIEEHGGTRYAVRLTRDALPRRPSMDGLRMAKENAA